MDSLHYYHHGTFHTNHSLLYQMDHLGLVYSRYHNTSRLSMVLRQIQIDAKGKSLKLRSLTGQLFFLMLSLFYYTPCICWANYNSLLLALALTLTFRFF